MAFTLTARNAMLDAQLPSGSASLSLHSGNPTDSGLNEISGGSPAYARKTVTLTAAASGEKTHSTGTVTFDVPAGATVAWLGIWVSSTLKFYAPLPAAQVFASQGTYAIPSLIVRLPG